MTLPIFAHISVWWKMIRPLNLLIIALTQISIRIFCVVAIDAPLVDWYNDIVFWKILGATLCVSAAGYIINDYYDIKIDLINKPKDVVIGKNIHRRGAILGHFFVNFIGLLLGFWANIWVGIICFFCEFFLWAYSSILKPLPLIGNVLVGFLTASSIWLLIIPYYFVNSKTYNIFIFGIFAFFITIVREIIKDMEDIKGDQAHSCKTLPIIWGIKRTKNVIYVFVSILIVILLSTYFSFGGFITLYFYIFIVPLLCIFMFLLNQALHKKEYHFLSVFCKMIMFLGILGMILI
ncbi:MAG: prenyltransferase [Cytophagia bacterium]|nr:MAG: prenyltransferase [Cytophagia bacterium]TAG44495.1 MAG: prenyltransferase [Cytophagia bacterium]TAH30745.1 MAG: prenyltransferase [Cytophagales bacterium]